MSVAPLRLAPPPTSASPSPMRAGPLLWTIDQLVYHRLLNSVFLVGLKLEFDNPRIPPIRSAMMVASGNRGRARLIAFFYAVPIGALGLTAVAVSAYHATTVDDLFSLGTGLSVAALFAVALLPCSCLRGSVGAGPRRTSKSARRRSATESSRG